MWKNPALALVAVFIIYPILALVEECEEVNGRLLLQRKNRWPSSGEDRQSIEVEEEAKANSSAWAEFWSSPSASSQRFFEECSRRPQKPQSDVAKTSLVAASARDPTLKAHCAAGSSVIGEWTELGSYKTKCCKEKGGASCSGCSKLNAAGAACEVCAAGYSLQKPSAGLGPARCVQCDDVLDWKDAKGNSCFDYERLGICSQGTFLMDNVTDYDAPVEGLRPSEVCCACGGGQLAATPWKHALSDQLLVFGANVSAKPKPATAEKFRVSKGCDLLNLGLSIAADGTVTGTVAAMGDDATGSASCQLTALQDEVHGVEADAPLSILVQPMSYGPKALVFAFQDGDLSSPTGQSSWKLKLAEGLQLDAEPKFAVKCVPDVPWVTVDATSGVLSYAAAAAESASGQVETSEAEDSSGGAPLEGGQCRLTAVTVKGKAVKSVFSILKVGVWKGMFYPEPRIVARKGNPIVPTELMRQPPPGFDYHKDKESGEVTWFKKGSGRSMAIPAGVPPSILDVNCSAAGVKVKWSQQNGVVSINGQSAFTLDPASGLVSGINSVDLPAKLGLSSLDLLCNVAASGDAYDHVLTTTLQLRLLDDTCWTPGPSKEQWAEPSPKTLGNCSVQCRARHDCGAYWEHEDNCWLQTSSSNGQVKTPPGPIAFRAFCEEGATCLDFHNSNARFLEGRYCPHGHQVGRQCSREVAHESIGYPSKWAGSGFILYSAMLARERFNSPLFSNSQNLLMARWENQTWEVLAGWAWQRLSPVDTDLLVAKVSTTGGGASPNIKLLGASRGTLNGIRFGYSTSDIQIAKEKEVWSKVLLNVTGSFLTPWECGEPIATVYSRDGVTSRDEFFMARGTCGGKGTWEIHRANETDYMSPETGDFELHGDLVACLKEDVETGAFQAGAVESSVWLPAEAGCFRFGSISNPVQSSTVRAGSVSSWRKLRIGSRRFGFASIQIKSGSCRFHFAVGSCSDTIPFQPMQ